MVAVWNQTHINLGAPGWRIGLPGEFDEREVAERHRALATAYIIIVLAVSGRLAFAGVVRMLNFAVPFLQLAPHDLTMLAVLLLPALPGIILAWRGRHIADATEIAD